MSLFDTINAAAKTVTNAVFGEDVRIVPTKAAAGVNSKGRVVDLARAAFDFTARFYQPTDLITAPDRRDIMRSGMNDRALHARGTITATIDYPPLKLRSDDMIYRLKDEAWFQITDVDPDGTGTYVLTLSPAASGPLEN